MVSRSARIWQGCSSSLRPLITGHAGIAGQRRRSCLLEGAGHDAVDHAAEDAGHVGDALALAEADVAGAEVEGVAAQLAHADLEGNAGARRGLLEDHGEALACQDGMPGHPILTCILRSRASSSTRRISPPEKSFDRDEAPPLHTYGHGLSVLPFRGGMLPAGSFSDKSGTIVYQGPFMRGPAPCQGPGQGRHAGRRLQGRSHTCGLRSGLGVTLTPPCGRARRPRSRLA